MVNLWWDCGDFVVNRWSYFGVENLPRVLDLFFGYSRFGNGFLADVGSEGGFGVGQQEQDEDQGFGGEHAEGGLLSVPVP